MKQAHGREDTQASDWTTNKFTPSTGQITPVKSEVVRAQQLARERGGNSARGMTFALKKSSLRERLGTGQKDGQKGERAVQEGKDEQETVLGGTTCQLSLREQGRLSGSKGRGLRQSELSWIWDVPGGPLVKTSPSSAGAGGSILDQGTKSPHAKKPKLETEELLQQIQ